MTRVKGHNKKVNIIVEPEWSANMIPPILAQEDSNKKKRVP